MQILETLKRTRELLIGFAIAIAILVPGAPVAASTVQSGAGAAPSPVAGYDIARFRQTFANWQVRGDDCRTEKLIIVVGGNQRYFRDSLDDLRAMSKCVADWRNRELARIDREAAKHGSKVIYRGTDEVRMACRPSTTDCELLMATMNRVLDRLEPLLYDIRDQSKRIARKYGRDLRGERMPW